jgi:hypothetical protein
MPWQQCSTTVRVTADRYTYFSETQILRNHSGSGGITFHPSSPSPHPRLEMKSNVVGSLFPFVGLVAASACPLMPFALPGSDHDCTGLDRHSSPNLAHHHHIARADCKYVAVASGDGCASLATKCGISGSDFTKYNPKLDCSKLQIDDVRLSLASLPIAAS